MSFHLYDASNPDALFMPELVKNHLLSDENRIANHGFKGKVAFFADDDTGIPTLVIWKNDYGCLEFHPMNAKMYCTDFSASEMENLPQSISAAIYWVMS